MDNFNLLVTSIQQLHHQLQQSAVNAVNQMLTIRNWLIGYYIVEFEQNGKDRAEYGKSLLKSIANSLTHVKGLDERSLRRFRLFYLYYPQLATTIRGTVTPKLGEDEKWGSVSPVFEQIEKAGIQAQKLEEGLFVQGKKILQAYIEKELKITNYE